MSKKRTESQQPREKGFAPAFPTSWQRVKLMRNEGGERHREGRRETAPGTFVGTRERLLSDRKRRREKERDIESRHCGLAVFSRSRRTKTHRRVSFCISLASQRSLLPSFPRLPSAFPSAAHREQRPRRVAANAARPSEAAPPVKDIG